MFTDFDQTITLAQAVALTQAFRAANPPTAVKAEVSGKTIIEQILAQTGCKGIRVYKGLDATGVPSNVLVGIDANGNDMVDGVLGNRSVKDLGSPNVLNS
ncbi:hypothetical protein CNR22_20375 [Sphingobacteriaceae bacterium]|nr:hypothetical protein CNR22_20375 [Sphingobacteriaceae bacterium]